MFTDGFGSCSAHLKQEMFYFTTVLLLIVFIVGYIMLHCVNNVSPV